MLKNINVYIENSTRMKKCGINVYIKEDGVHVHKSRFVTKKEVEDFLKEIEDQIIKSYNKIKSKKKIDLTSQNKVMYKGHIYDIKRNKSNKDKVIVDTYNKLFKIDLKEDSVEYLKLVLKKYLANELKEFVLNESNMYAEKMNVRFNAIRIKDNKTNYGSCSSNKNLNYNFRLMQMPEKVASYVVCHEISHLVHMDHSKAFWNNVSKFYGDYSVAKSWIKENDKYFI